MKIGIVRETKTPPDSRVPLIPKHCRQLLDEYKNLEIFVQPSDFRAYTNEEYAKEGIVLKEDLSDCDVLMGVKEVKKSELLPKKTYFFFSHTAKKQPYNRELLQTIVEKNIQMVDYEYLKSDNGVRVVAFGRWAGVVGAYNGLREYGKRFKIFELKPAWQCHDSRELFLELKKVVPGNYKLVITGGGRVAKGAEESLLAAGFLKVNPTDFLNKKFNGPIFTQLEPWDYVKRLDGQNFELQHFFNFPEAYQTIFKPYTKVADIYVPCHFWDPRSPVFMTKKDLKEKDFNIKVIADISCDINGPVPSTIRASSIAQPVYGYNPVSESESDPYADENITVMAVDNLPGELPRDASEDFGNNLIKEVIPFLLTSRESRIIEKASITKNGALTREFSYLNNYLIGLE
ncbi:MAG: NAD(P)-dependent oxidoreductase [Bacteroidales bacterium]|nr:NAD(P)-dependent oxidoreductase [Bacteroidales bacterium]MCF8391638.1 NAD(P)-dependent oxidoreductase [Bacteroidales bacterium]